MNRTPYKVTREFELDFFDVQEWLYLNESFERAEKIIRSILEKMEYINQNPRHFPEHKLNDASKSLRKAVHFDTYHIFYSEHEEHVEFISVFHGKRNRVN